MYEHLKIGSQIYAVHKRYVDEKLGGKIVVCRTKSFENIQGEIIPILTEVGNAKHIVSPKTHYIYLNLPDAIDAIRTENHG